MIVDAHQHFWTTGRTDYGWLTPDLTGLYRDYQPTDLAPLLAAHGVEATVLVQAAPSEAETRYLLGIAREWPKARAVVGWVDMTDADAAERLEDLAQDPRLRGVRPMIQDEPDRDWMLQPSVGEALRGVVRCGLSFDALVKPWHLSALAVLVDRHPDLRVVIDHGAKPDIAAGAYGSWADDIRAISRRPQVMCKLSGLLNEAGPRTADAGLALYVDHLLDCFGPARLMWGSDWPVLTEAGDYGGWYDQARRLLQGLSGAEQAQVFGLTAAGFYGIEGAS